MTIRHTLLFSLLAVLGGFLGGMFARPVVAQAQVVPPVKFVNEILVPRDGLKYVDESGRTVAFLGVQAGNGLFTIVDANGRPSVSLVSSPGGTVTLRSTADGGMVETASLDGSKSTRILSGATGSSIEVKTNSSTMSLSNRGNGATLLLPLGNGSKGVEFVSTQSGGSLTMYMPNGKAAVTVEGGATGGLFHMRDASGAVTASISGSGVFAALRSGKTVWQAPPSD